MTNELGIVIDNNRPVVSSRKVAEVFEKEHNIVMRSIRDLVCGDDFSRCNFAQSTYMSDRGKEYPEYLMTRDGFTLLAMGFTGSKAMQWKIKYIETFNRMEAELSTSFAIPRTYAEALHLAAELEDKRLMLEAKIEQDAPYTETGKAITASHDCITIAQFVPILKEAGIENGHDGKRLWQNNLYAMLRADGFLLKRPNNMPSADARTEKIFFVEEKTNYDKYGNSHINTTTLITGKGQTTLINYYKKKEGLL